MESQHNCITEAAIDGVRHQGLHLTRPSSKARKMLTRIVCLKEGRLEDSPTCSTAPLIEEGLHGISLTHAFGLPLLWAMRASEKTLICRTRRVPRAYLSGMWPARVGLSSPELLASSWGHICYTTAKGRPFFLIKESNFTTQNGLGLLPQIQ